MNTSASLSFWQVRPEAPALSCILAMSGILWVLMWGRCFIPAASTIAWARAMFFSSRSRSMVTTGVSRS